MKRILTLVLALAMLLSVSAVAFAETGVSTQAREENGIKFKGTVKIGSVMCETGAVAGVGIPYSQFYKLFVKYINEVMGGVAKGADGLGYYLDHTSYDDGTDGAQGFIYMQKLIEDDQVFALVGNLGTWNIASSQAYIVESGVPSVYWGTGSALQYYLPAEGNQRFTFPVQPIYRTEGRIMLARALNMPAIEGSGVAEVKKVGLIYSADDSGNHIFEGVDLQYSQLPADKKPEIVYVKVNTQVADEMTSQVAQLEGCDVVIIGGLQAYFNPIYTAMQANPATRGLPTISSYVNVALTNIPVDVAAQPDTGDIYGGAWVVIDPAAQTEQQAAEILEFQQVLAWGRDKGYITQADHDAYVGSAYSMSSFIALNVFMEGINRLADKEITRDNFLAAMESERIHVPISGGVDYSNGQRIGLDGMAFARFNKGYTNAFDAFFTVDGMKSIGELLGE
jgi:ABC-type branched-subunit amino acid transport system substrate-binding protein